MTGRDFAHHLAAELGLDPLEEEDITAILALASTAAHASERLAAPLCTYLAGRSGRPVAEVQTAAEGLGSP